jgi:hypothetical protein
MYCEVNGWVIQFRTRLQGLVRDQWYNLTSRLNHVCLNNEKDYIYWKRTPSKTFTVKSVYDHLTKDDDGPKFQRVWKAKIPEKIKTSMWLVEQAILTKDNMMKQNWQGDPMCYFCEGLESIDHLFFECPTVKVIWGVIAICSAKGSGQNPMNNSGSGSLLHFQEGINSICLVWQPYAGQYGSVGITFALKRN